MILYLTTNDSTKKLFWQSSRIQNQHKKTVAFLYTNNEQAEKEIRKRIPFPIASKKLNTYK
jgi:hypothetical protein